MFEWQTGDDGEWVEPEAAPAAARFGRRAKGLLAAGLLLLLVCLMLLYRQVGSQVTGVTQTIEQTVLAADRLLLETAVAGDTELFASLVSHRFRDWHELQTRLLARSLWLERAPLGLWLAGDTDLFAAELLPQTQVDLAPDLAQAVVIRPMPYVTMAADGSLQPLTLQRTAVYRLQENSWLLTAPDRAFWGDYRPIERPHLALLTPARDAEIAARLADDLSDLIVRVCTQVVADTVVHCPPNFTLQLRLANDPESLISLYSTLRLSTVYLGGRQATRFSLPTPTLVGLPLDEAGYNALYRAYATHLSLALLNAYAANAATLPGGPFVEPNFVQMLAALGLFTPWPPEYSPIRAAAPPPIPLPEQDILLLCMNSRTPNLFRHARHDGLWYDVPRQTSGELSYNMTPLPDGKGIFLTVFSLTDVRSHLVWINNGRERIIVMPAENISPHPRNITPVSEGKYLLLFAVYRPNHDTPLSYCPGVLDEAACSDSACELQPFKPQVLPSPDGRYSLIITINEAIGFMYALGDAEGNVLQEIGAVANWFWLDERTLAFVQWQASAEKEGPGHWGLVTAVFPEEPSGSIVVQARLEQQDLLNALPASERRTELSPFSAFSSSHHPDQVLLTISSWQGQSHAITYLFTYAWREERLALLWPEMPAVSAMLFLGQSPYGRYLLFVDNATDFLLHLYDLERETWQQYQLRSPRFFQMFNFSWSEDDAWLILHQKDAVRLVAPAYNYEKVLFHGLHYCEAAVWVEWDP